MRARRGAGRAATAALVVALAIVAFNTVWLGGATHHVEVAGAVMHRTTPLETLVLPKLPPAGSVAVDPAAPPPPGDAVIAPPPESFGEAPAPPTPPPSELAQRFAGTVPQGGTWAVVIGINDYPGSRYDLRSAVNDANDVNEALARMGVPGDHRLLIRDRQATADVMGVAVEWLAAHAGPDATVVFFYAGHVRKVGGGTEAIVGADGRLLTDHDLAARLSKVQARRVWVGLAACYSGGFTEVLGPGRVLTAAANADSLAYENLDFGRSYMVEYMVRRGWLENRAGGTVQEAFAYARDNLTRDYPSRVPVQVDRLGSPLELRPPGAPPASPRRQEPQAPPPQPAPQPAPPPSGGGSQPPPPPKDSCAGATLGVVRCS